MRDYLENLNSGGMSGAWEPVGEWNPVHGDNKSTTGGKWGMAVMTTTSENSF